jgi:ABC-type multidrug transport system ATPase subunit
MADAAIRVEHLVKTFGSSRRGAVRAVDDLSFDVPRGAIFGLLGPNGAGKTTTLRVLTTVVRPTSGRASVLGFDVVRQAGDVRRRIVVVIQEQAAELFLSVRENLLTFARFHGRSGPEVARRAERVLGELGLASDAHRKVQDLSGGYRRRVQVAKVFMVDTPVVFLDEFSTGMDPALKRSVMALLRQEVAHGRTIVLTTQILGDAEELCDDILIIDKGREVARGDLATLKLLSDRVYEVMLSFERVPDQIHELLQPFRALRVETNGTTVHLTIKDDEARVLGLVNALASKGRLLRMEINGATLEDVFLQLTGKGAA